MWEVPPFAYGPALIFATFAGMGQEMLTLLPSEMEIRTLYRVARGQGVQIRLLDDSRTSQLSRG